MKNLSHILPALLLVAAAISCQKEDEFTYDTSLPALREKLYAACESPDRQKMADFFADWARALPPTPQSEIDRSPALQAYGDLCRQLYAPFDPQSPFGMKNEIGLSAQYVVINSGIRYGVSELTHFDTVDLTYLEDKNREFIFRSGADHNLPEFRLPVDPDNVAGKSVVYGTENYYDAFREYLADFPTEPGDDSFCRKMVERGEIFKPYLVLYPKHINKIMTLPSISIAYFSKNLDEAWIEYQLNMMVMVCHAVNKEGVWSIGKKMGIGAIDGFICTDF